MKWKAWKDPVEAHISMDLIASRGKGGQSSLHFRLMSWKMPLPWTIILTK